MDSIQSWNESTNIWRTVFDSSLMTVQEEEALIVRQMYPYHEKHTLLCFTFKEDIRSFVPMLKFKRKGRQYFFDVSIILYFTLRYNKNFLIHFLDSITDRIYIYVHHVGQFLQIAIRNSLTELISMDGTTYLNVELLVSQSLSTSSQPCNENASVYDKCVFDMCTLLSFQEQTHVFCPFSHNILLLRFPIVIIFL
jgi:hypothetical protein